VSTGRLIIGVFHPALNGCGGAEWVAVNIINTLKESNHRIVSLTNERIDQAKIMKVFGRKVKVDSEIIFPLEFFPVTDLHNVYTDGFRTMLLKSRCDVLIDTHSNAILPGADVTYVHFPLYGRLQIPKMGKLRSSYYLPYLLYERRTVRQSKRLVFSNSKYTQNAISSITGMRPELLYPPISNVFYIDTDDSCLRENIVVSVSRISPEKRLDLVPRIAKFTDKNIRFLIIGIKQSPVTLEKLVKTIKACNVENRVEVLTDVPRAKLLAVLRTAKAFLHVTDGEHFGVSIAEAMASGCIPVVHDSGGPKEFVPNALRFNGLEEAAKKLERAVFKWSPQESNKITNIARSFSEESFSSRFLKVFNSYRAISDN